MSNEYDTTKLRVTSDYGEAHCPHCGEALAQKDICIRCHLPIEQVDIAYVHEIRISGA